MGYIDRWGNYGEMWQNRRGGVDMGGGGDLVLLPLDPLAIAVTFRNPRSILASDGPCPLITQHHRKKTQQKNEGNDKDTSTMTKTNMIAKTNTKTGLEYKILDIAKQDEKYGLLV